MYIKIKFEHGHLIQVKAKIIVFSMLFSSLNMKRSNVFEIWFSLKHFETKNSGLQIRVRIAKLFSFEHQKHMFKSMGKKIIKSLRK